jgi:hypothetical protein
MIQKCSKKYIVVPLLKLVIVMNVKTLVVVAILLRGQKYLDTTVDGRRVGVEKYFVIVVLKGCDLAKIKIFKERLVLINEKKHYKQISPGKMP